MAFLATLCLCISCPSASVQGRGSSAYFSPSLRLPFVCLSLFSSRSLSPVFFTHPFAYLSPSFRLSFNFISLCLQFAFRFAFILPFTCLRLALCLISSLSLPYHLPFFFLCLPYRSLFDSSFLGVFVSLSPYVLVLHSSPLKKKEVNNAYPYFLFPFSLPCSPIMVHLALFSPIKFLVAFPLPLFSSLGRNHRP